MDRLPTTPTRAPALPITNQSPLLRPIMASLAPESVSLQPISMGFVTSMPAPFPRLPGMPQKRKDSDESEWLDSIGFKCHPPWGASQTEQSPRPSTPVKKTTLHHSTPGNTPPPPKRQAQLSANGTIIPRPLLLPKFANPPLTPLNSPTKDAAKYVNEQYPKYDPEDIFAAAAVHRRYLGSSSSSSDNDDHTAADILEHVANWPPSRLLPHYDSSTDATDPAVRYEKFFKSRIPEFIDAEICPPVSWPSSGEDTDRDEEYWRDHSTLPTPMLPAGPEVVQMDCNGGIMLRIWNVKGHRVEYEWEEDGLWVYCGKRISYGMPMSKEEMRNYYEPRTWSKGAYSFLLLLRAMRMKRPAREVSVHEQEWRERQARKEEMRKAMTKYAADRWGRWLDGLGGEESSKGKTKRAAEHRKRSHDLGKEWSFPQQVSKEQDTSDEAYAHLYLKVLQ